MAELAKDIQKKEATQPDRIEQTRARRVYQPDVDIVETKEAIFVTADMPGIDETSVDLTLEKNLLTIYGKVDEVAQEGYSPAYAQYGIGDYRRVFTLSDEVDRDKIEATVKDGVLKLILPKAEAAKTRKIVVTQGS